MRRTLLLAATLACLLPSWVGAAPLDDAIRAEISKGPAARASWGVYAIDAATGREVADVNGSHLFLPASNRKVISTALALETMGGPTATVETVVHSTAAPAGGTVAGDLVVKAVGDPSWVSELLGGRSGRSVLMDLARQVAAAGVSEVSGDLVIDTSRFREPESFPPGWDWENMQESYGSIASVLGYNRNLASVTVTPGGRGQPVGISVGGAESPFEVINTSTTGGADAPPTLDLRRSLDGTRLFVRGSVASNTATATRAVPMGAPTRFAGAEFKALLAEAGVTVRGTLRLSGEAIPVGTRLASVKSAPLGDIIAITNRESDNFLAESVYLLAGAAAFSRGSYEASQKAEERLWTRLKITRDEYESADGSGLSRKNLVTPHAMVTLLNSMKDNDAFVDSLAVSGRRGTLRFRLGDDGMAGRVKAKTGTLDGVTALSGYVTTSGGRTIVFSILANNHSSSNAPIRTRVDNIVSMMARQ